MYSPTSFLRLLMFSLAFVYLSGLGFTQDVERDSTLNNLVHPEGYRTAKPRELGHVEKMGNGDVDVILIPGFGFGWKTYENFMNSNLNRYRMFAITPPGYDGTPAPPMPPEGTSYGEQTRNTWIEEAIVRLIAEQGLRKPIIVGHFMQATGLAFRLAIDHPDKISSVVIIAGEAARIFSPQKGEEASLEERISFVDKNWPPWFKTITKGTWDSNNFKPEVFSRNPQKAKWLWQEAAKVPLPVNIRYLCEFFASDVTLEYHKIKVPTLVLLPDFDEALLAKRSGSSTYFVKSWAGVEEKIENVQVQTIQDAHVFIMVDQPQALNTAIWDFVKENTVL